jgi:hypothetical protein
MSKRTAIVGGVLLVVPVLALGLLRLRLEPPAAAVVQQIPQPALPEAIADLQRRLDSGETNLTFDEDRGGYLRSLLERLQIPLSSQTLAFAKSSAQLFLIAPDAPRAIYFNDEVYVGYVQGGALEIASVDPHDGPVFYTLVQLETPKPRFNKEPTDCFACHDTFEADKPVSRLLMLSVLADRTGVALNRSATITNDRSPFAERWGGWYVTGTHGSIRHMGNRIVREPASALGEIRNYAKTADLSDGANVTSLAGRFDPKPYLTASSDIAAMMVLGHQTHLHNLITVAGFNLRASTSEPVPEAKIKEYAEPLVETMLFSGAAPQTSPVSGTTNFAVEFSARGPHDSKGRSLHQLDLQTRLLRYPLSYLIYSKSFDALPEPARRYVYRRLHAILSGEDKSAGFSHLSSADREAIREILTETKPEFAALR